MDEKIKKLEQEVEQLKKIIEHYEESLKILEQAIANKPHIFGI